MKVVKLPNNNLIIPKRAETDGATGDGIEEITPSHPDYKEWLKFVIDDRSQLQDN